LQDADRPLLAFGDFTNAPNVCGVLFVRAVGKIQPSNVHASAHQCAQHFFIMRGRTNGTNDFGAAVLRVAGRKGKACARRIRLAGCQNWTIPWNFMLSSFYTGRKILKVGLLSQECFSEGTSTSRA